MVPRWSWLVLLAAACAAPGRMPLPPLPSGAEPAPRWSPSQVSPPVVTATALRVAAYNIKHGRGMDDRLDLDRTAAAIARLEADVVALQEVDLAVRRSGDVNEPEWLGERLGMHSTFGAFMDYQGGRYGMAILSRWPIERSFALRLPDGNEPRVALVAELRLPDGELLTVVDVHFDWVADDAFRFAQAETVAAYLDSLRLPYVLLGDFNDQPGSRTLQRFAALATQAAKPAAAAATFPADAPHQEIDFVFVGPPAQWRAARAWVAEEPLASDHRPVVAELTRR